MVKGVVEATEAMVKLWRQEVVSSASIAEWAWDTLAVMKLRVVKGVGHLGHVEATEAGGHEFSLHGRVVKGVGHLGHGEAMEAGGR